MNYKDESIQEAIAERNKILEVNDKAEFILLVSKKGAELWYKGNDLYLSQEEEKTLINMFKL